ncbi:hypothetical protein LTR65_005011 [Meristemomyces frigidus]
MREDAERVGRARKTHEEEEVAARAAENAHTAADEEARRVEDKKRTEPEARKEECTDKGRMPPSPPGSSPEERP